MKEPRHTKTTNQNTCSSTKKLKEPKYTEAQQNTFWHQNKLDKLGLALLSFACFAWLALLALLGLALLGFALLGLACFACFACFVCFLLCLLLALLALLLASCLRMHQKHNTHVRSHQRTQVHTTIFHFRTQQRKIMTIMFVCSPSKQLNKGNLLNNHLKDAHEL